MAIELEKKWLVDKDKCPLFDMKPNLLDMQVLETVQGYLPFQEEDSWIIRARHVKVLNSPYEWWFLDLKSKGLLAREEISYKISPEEFEESIKKCNGNIVRKTRYCHNTGGYKLEVDIYKDHDFVTCEVEFLSMKEANNFVPPDWCTEEITFDPAYKNMNLGV